MNSATFALTAFPEVRWHERERSCAAFARQGGNHIPELDSPDLLHQVQCVVVGPLLLDFAPGDPINEDAPYARLIAGRSVAHKLPLMSAASPPASNHHLTLGI